MAELGLQIDNYGSINSLKKFLLISDILQWTDQIWLIIDCAKPKRDRRNSVNNFNY